MSILAASRINPICLVHGPGRQSSRDVVSVLVWISDAQTSPLPQQSYGQVVLQLGLQKSRHLRDEDDATHRIDMHRVCNTWRQWRRRRLQLGCASHAAILILLRHQEAKDRDIESVIGQVITLSRMFSLSFSSPCAAR